MDISLVEVQKDLTLKVVHKTSKGECGGARVDQSFKEMIEALVNPADLEQFALKNALDYIDMFRDFEIKKRCLKYETEGQIIMKIPVSLYLYYKMAREDFPHTHNMSKYKDEVRLVRDKLIISAECFKEFFKVACSDIVEHIRQMIHSPEVRGTDKIIMIGGFSESPMLQQVVKNAFPQCSIIIPQEPGMAVLKGAVLFGHNPHMTTAQIRYTYKQHPSMVLGIILCHAQKPVLRRIMTSIENRTPVIVLRRKVTGVHFLRPEGSIFVCRKRVITPKSRNNNAEKSGPL